jgi:hypothetical protein
MRTGFVGYVSAAHADVPTIAPAVEMQITAIRFMARDSRECTGTV